MNRPITIAICLFLSLIIGVGLLWPKYQDLNILQMKIKKEEIEIKNIKDYLSQLKKTSQGLEEYKQALSKIDSALPLYPSLPSLFDFLQKSSSHTGLVLENIGMPIAARSEEKPDIREYYINLSLSGSYSSFKNFLSLLEKSARFFEVENISFSSPREKESSISFSLRIKTHSY